jgi:hypothetical protein
MGSHAREREANVVEDWELLKRKAREVGFECVLERSNFRLRKKELKEQYFRTIASANAFLKGWETRRQYTEIMGG